MINSKSSYLQRYGKKKKKEKIFKKKKHLPTFCHKINPLFLQIIGIFTILMLIFPNPMLIFLNFMKNFIKNYTLSISFHYLCNQKSDIRLSGKALFHLIRWNNSINQFKKV